MRPVERGLAPTGATTYEEMRPTLFARIGQYCSYCEFPVMHQPHAEHIVPKDRYPTWRDRWDNLLVACSWCNGHKGDALPAPQNLSDYLWPSTDNTARAFEYTNVVPRVARAIPVAMQTKAARTRGLVKLGAAGADDPREKKRAETFILAQSFHARMQHAPNRALVEDAIVALALAQGFFSTWMEVFASDIPMRRRLIAAFVGTPQGCFDPVTTQPVQRPGGQV